MHGPLLAYMYGKSWLLIGSHSPAICDKIGCSLLVGIPTHWSAAYMVTSSMVTLLGDEEIGFRQWDFLCLPSLLSGPGQFLLPDSFLKGQSQKSPAQIGFDDVKTGGQKSQHFGTFKFSHQCTSYLLKITPY